MKNDALQQLTNEQLILEVKTLASREREATAKLIASLVELDTRRLYLGEGYSSLFAYCTRCLHLSEHAAYGRIEAVRIARRLPGIVDWLANGSITLTTLCLLGPHLTAENHQALLRAATHKSKREVEQQVAALRPLPDAPAAIRKLPAQAAAIEPQLSVPCSETRVEPQASGTTIQSSCAPVPLPAPSRRSAVIAPLAPERFKVQFTMSRETHDKFRRVQDLLRHSVPDGDPALIFDRALTLLMEELERKKLAQTNRPRTVARCKRQSRHVPAAVKREVWSRDGGQCAFMGTDGRCKERGFLEFHHVVPYADGGETSSENLQLRCRAHNAYEAREHFGPLLLREKRAPYQLGPDRTLGELESDRRCPPRLATCYAGPSTPPFAESVTWKKSP